MNYLDHSFFLFLLLSFLLYFALPLRARWISLLVFSFVFFLTWGADYVPLVLAVTLIAWAGGLVLDRRNRAEGGKRSRAAVLIPAALILLVLVYVKAQYAMVQSFMEPVVAFFSGVHGALCGFLREIPVLGDLVSTGEGWQEALYSWLFGSAGVSPAAAAEAAAPSVVYTWIVPLGVSYYSLSLIGYLADVYWKKERAEKNWFRLLLFTLYFPKLLEGPISKHRTVAPRLAEGHRFDYTRFCFGLQRMVWGFFKKLVIADRLSVPVNAVFGNYLAHTGSEFLVAAVFGAVQLYCDFSGCMDIALGVSECFGVTLEENFRQPFAARSAAEFWRRWHISLGVWFKDYVYMPLAVSPRLVRISGFLRKKVGKQAGKNFLTVIPLAVVWILTGLWHGTGENYLVWGAYWGLLIILSVVFDPLIRKITKGLKADPSSVVFRAFQKTRTFFLFVISRIISIPGTLAVSWYAFSAVFTDFAPWKLVDGSLYKLGLDRPRFIVTLLAVALVGFIGSRREKGTGIRKWIAALPLPVRWAIYLAAVFAVLVFGAYGPGYNAGLFTYMRY